MVLAHDTDNIPEIPGIPLHPVQVAEQERLAQLQKVTGTEDIPAPTPESVKDMSSATRQILEKIGSLLKEARPLAPSDTQPKNRAEAPAALPASAARQSNIASATGGSVTGAAKSLPEPATTQSPEAAGGSPVPP
jgi:thioesterase domain-containing protein